MEIFTSFQLMLSPTQQMFFFIDKRPVGYKDSEQSQYGLQHMNLICQPVVELGRAAGRQLLERLKNPNMPVQKVLLQAEFQPAEEL